MYWCTLSLITCQAPPITRIDVKVVRTIRATAIPSTPMWELVLMPGIQCRFSCNWKPPGPIWYCVSITRLKPKVMTVNASVSQRARCGRALPASTTMIAPRHGNQTRTLRMGQLLMQNPWSGTGDRQSDASTYPLPSEGGRQPEGVGGHCTGARSRFSSCSSQPPEPKPAEQQDQPDDHRERVVVQKAGLQATEHARAALDHRRGPVEHHAVQHRAIAALPERAAQLHAAAGEQVVVHLVHPVLAGEHPEDREEHPRGTLGDGGVEQIYVGRDEEARERDPERRAQERVPEHRHGAVEFLGHARQHVMRGQYLDRVTEPAVVQQRLDREPADDD